MHLLITDSGLGGLSVCAGTEKALRLAGAGSVRITYFNAWPEQESGYNDLPDIASRARQFDRALAAMGALRPDCIAIACNTLSIVYDHTTFRRSTTIPVVGIVEAGVERFVGALTGAPDGVIALFGTRTTIESGVHRARLIERGIAPERISATSCHGLARAIEMAPDGGTITNLIEHCTGRAARALPVGDPVYLGICCTHYTYVGEQMREALQRKCGRAVHVLDPNDSLVAVVLSRVRAAIEGDRTASPGADRRRAGQAAVDSDLGPATDRHAAAGTEPALPESRVTVISKVEMDHARRESIARRVQDVSPATARALLSYTRVPDLF